MRNGLGRCALFFCAVGILPLFCGCTVTSARPGQILRTVFNISPHADAVGTHQFVRQMDKHTGTELRSGNRVTMLVNGGQVFPKMLAAIRCAETRISFETYILRTDKVGNEFLEALIAARKRGVTVRFMHDAVGTKSVDKAKVDALVDAGAEVRVFNPLTHWTALRFNNRDHRKILVVDGRVAFLGGLNLGEEYDGNGTTTGWHDMGVRIEGPAALDAERVFAETWQQGGAGFFGKDLPVIGLKPVKRVIDEPFLALLGKDFVPPDSRPAKIDGGAKVRIVSTRPDMLASPILDMYLLAINSAQKRVWITNSYFVPPILLSRALARAVRRGVDVRILVAGPTDEPVVQRISIGFYGRILENNIRLYEWQPSVLHAKTMVVDGVWSTIGSANLDNRALFLNYESNAVVLDRRFGQAMERQFLKDLKNAREITLEEWKNRPIGHKAQEILMVPVEGQF